MAATIADMVMELLRREKELKIEPNLDADNLMKVRENQSIFMNLYLSIVG